MENIKIGGCYKTKEGWLLVNTKHGNTWSCHDIIIDEGVYDDEISDMTKEEIEKIADLSICYAPKYHKKYGLYEVWDQAKPHSERIILQKVTK